MSRMRVASGFLAEMSESSHARAWELAERVGRTELERHAHAAPPPPPLVLSATGFDLVAEVKLVSPAAGRLTSEADDGAIAARARRYADAGACALSVLTEPTRFGGADVHLEAAARAVRVPVMRKDFLVDPLQILEARAVGAAGVLLVLRLLDGTLLEAMLAEAERCKLFVLLEAFDGVDLERAREALEGERRPRILVGVNARDLATLAIDPQKHAELAPRLPPGTPCVAESGLETSEQVRAVAEAGYRAALVGSALMRAADPATTARALLAAGREGAR